MNFDLPPDNKNESSGNPLPIEKNKDSVKENIASIFQLQPELASIGTEEQYRGYLATIFPESTVKDILWHTSDAEFKNFDLSKSGGGTYGTGIYFDKELRVEDAPFKYPAVVELKKPIEISHDVFKDPKELDRLFDIAYKFLDAEREVKKEEVSEKQKKDIVGVLLGATHKDLTEYKKNFPSLEKINSIDEYFETVENLIGNDGVIQYRNSDFKTIQEYVVFLPSQIQILGSEEDLEDFKKFKMTKQEKENENIHTIEKLRQEILNMPDTNH